MERAHFCDGTGGRDPGCDQAGMQNATPIVRDRSRGPGGVLLTGWAAQRGYGQSDGGKNGPVSSTLRCRITVGPTTRYTTK